MPLWGTKDTVYSTGNVNVNVTTGVVTRQSGTIAWTSGNGVKVGQVITVDGTAEGVIKSIDTATGNSAQLTITTEHLPAANISNKGYEIREKPITTLGDTNYGAGEIYGVSVAEQQETVDDNSQYHPAHSGWVGITTYLNHDGTLRVKTEVLVANSTISGDSTDDTILPDS